MGTKTRSIVGWSNPLQGKDAWPFSTLREGIQDAVYPVQDRTGRRVVKAYVIINQPDQRVGSGFTLYVAMAESPGEALAVATAEFGLTGRSEVNGVPISDQGARALAFLPGEVRLVHPEDVEVRPSSSRSLSRG